MRFSILVLAVVAQASLTPFAQADCKAVLNTKADELTTVSSLMITEKKLMEKFQSESGYKEKVTEYHNSSLRGLNSSMVPFNIAGSVYGGVYPLTMALAYWNYRTTTNFYALKDNASVMKGATAISIPLYSGLAVSHLSLAMGDTSSKIIIDEDKLTAATKFYAEKFATALCLDLAQENSIRAAIEAEARKKARAKDEDPINLFRVVENAKFKGEKVLSEDKAAALRALEKAANETPADKKQKKASFEDKVQYLGFATAVFEVERDKHPDRSSAYKDLNNLVEKNRRFLNEVANCQSASKRAGKNAGSESTTNTQDESGQGVSAH